MNFFKFESVGFIISLGITLLLCGLIMFYVRQRFAAYDRHLVEQSQLLKHLVSTIQSNAVNASRQDVAAPAAVKAAEKVFSNPETKIVVSDDEVDSESDEETDSESDSSDSETSKESQGDSKCCDTLGKCPVTSFPLGNMFSLLANNQNKIKLEKNRNDVDSDDSESVGDGDEDSDSDEDSKSSKSSRDSLNDFVNRTEEIKHIEFSPHLDGLKVVGEDELMDKLNIQSLESSVVDSSKLNLEEIHVKKLDDVIQDDEDNKSSSLISNLKDLSKKALQDLCKERNLPINGTRGELIKRLTQ